MGHVRIKKQEVLKMIKEKEMVEIRDKVRFQDGSSITHKTIQDALSDAAKAHGIPIAFSYDQIKYGGMIGGSTVDCTVVYHPQHEKDYFKLAVRLTHQGNYAFVSVFSFGVSRLMGNEDAHENMINDLKAGFKNHDSKSIGGAVGSVLGAGIRRVIKGGRDTQALDEEKNWYAMVGDLFDEIVS